jgi:hypothetical protein
VSDQTPNTERAQYRIAQQVFSTLLSDQISRAESLNATAGVLAGLGGVITTLASVVPHLLHRNLGLAGISVAGCSVVLAVVGRAESPWNSTSCWTEFSKPPTSPSPRMCS